MTGPRTAALTAAARLAVAVTLTVAAPATAATPRSAPAATTSAWPVCDKTMGQRLPVLLVHGFRSDPTTWDAAADTLGAVTGACYIPFDYTATSTRWVTDKDNARRLAQLIVSFANRSARQGGPGKVAIVAHSMGGLMARCAATKSCHGGPDDAASKIASVSTLGTPNTGTFWRGGLADPAASLLGYAVTPLGCLLGTATGTGLCDTIRELANSDAGRAFTPGSPQLADLPALPGTIPVYAVAGSLRVQTSLFGAAIGLGEVGDAVVGTDSALAAAREVGGLGGTSTVDCGAVDLAQDQPLATATCHHVTETADERFLAVAADEVRRAVRHALAGALRHDGWGPAHIGTPAVAMDRLAAPLGLEGSPGNFSTDESAVCNRWSSDAKGIAIKATNGTPDDTVFEITVFGDKDTGQPRLPGGIGIGSPRRQVLAAYPGGQDYGGDAFNGYQVDITGPTALSFRFGDGDRVQGLTVMAEQWLDYDETCG